MTRIVSPYPPSIGGCLYRISAIRRRQAVPLKLTAISLTPTLRCTAAHEGIPEGVFDDFFSFRIKLRAHLQMPTKTGTLPIFCETAAAVRTPFARGLLHFLA